MGLDLPLCMILRECMWSRALQICMKYFHIVRSGINRSCFLKCWKNTLTRCQMKEHNNIKKNTNTMTHSLILQGKICIVLHGIKTIALKLWIGYSTEDLSPLSSEIDPQRLLIPILYVAHCLLGMKPGTESHLDGSETKNINKASAAKQNLTCI